MMSTVSDARTGAVVRLSIPSLLLVFAASVSFLVAAPLHAMERVALVIGNADYARAPTLENPVNDARGMEAKLTKLGFAVTKLENATKDQMEEAIVAFEGKLGPDKIGLFYYAGHGVQVRDKNYLIPVDATIEQERRARIEALDVSLVTDAMRYARSKVNFIILDACRDNPFERKLRGSSRGLAAVDAAGGTLIAYATAPGSVASDGNGKNGVYTGALLAALDEPGLSAEQVFKSVRKRVSSATDGQQTPWESSSLTGDFVFNAPAPVQQASPVQRATPVQTPAPRVVTEAALELTFWNDVKGTGNVAMFEEYLRQYPTGRFAGLAGIRISSLNKRAPQAVSSTRTSAPSAKPDSTALNRKRIAELLNAADVDVAGYRLTSPKGSNAVEKYREVLGLDADNADALAGLNGVVGKYIGMARNTSSRSKKNTYLDRAEKVMPGTDAVRRARALARAAPANATTSRSASMPRRPSATTQKKCLTGSGAPAGGLLGRAMTLSGCR
jgi:uncharacterized caspase-like protein